MNKSGYKLALLVIFFLSLFFRFWRVDFFNTLVFDEVYYPVFANRYLLGEPVYNAHPPLSQYLIAVGIWLGEKMPFPHEITNGFLGSVRSTFSYRWLNALTGAFIPLVIGEIAYRLTRRRSYGAIAALLAALDGLFLVESRFALNNIYLVLFGLLGQLLLFLALDTPPNRRWSKLLLSGLFFGLSAAIKWNGLGFLLGIYLVAFLHLILVFIRQPRDRPADSPPVSRPLPLQNLQQLTPLAFILYLGVIPVATYCLSWIPHLLMNPKPSFWEMQQRILSFHQSVGNGPKVHPYCSPWYSWFIMERPVAYLYQTARDTREAIPSLPPLPPASAKVIYDVHAMGNPPLWWLSSAAILGLLFLILKRLWQRQLWQESNAASSWLGVYLLCNFGANLLPWLKVTRCTFIYHYMAASVFCTLALAWFIELLLHSRRYIFRQIALASLAIAILGFIYWLPIFIGLPLSPTGYKIRMFFRNWI
ncbi:phospholipid carrier-dependent glycosyltransferase [Oscillatoria sp. FACHB-1406]|uniref:phospholipid carrier-dependent glycosyltransferase n=1 Tax=Oscillatoria sp. FACHB-1406 TaxID=2692846 RepID=UPI0016873E5C|nr:phospholipid carrier-dependent glycosyltransferase [Oscillatoria sp. FACHB-1406]MBD2576125.1 phospholipid carrier-dependent glycosyltransferase [Oscillatoria sp. FACHB-1406]